MLRYLDTPPQMESSAAVQKAVYGFNSSSHCWSKNSPEDVAKQ